MTSIQQNEKQQSESPHKTQAFIVGFWGVRYQVKPAARAVGLEWVNWRCLRTSRATWMVEAGANPKDVQGQMRHSRISTTMDIYAQFVPESARRAMDKTREMVERPQAAIQRLTTQAVQ